MACISWWKTSDRLNDFRETSAILQCEKINFLYSLDTYTYSLFIICIHTYMHTYISTYIHAHKFTITKEYPLAYSRNFIAAKCYDNSYNVSHTRAWDNTVRLTMGILKMHLWGEKCHNKIVTIRSDVVFQCSRSFVMVSLTQGARMLGLPKLSKSENSRFMSMPKKNW